MRKKIERICKNCIFWHEADIVTNDLSFKGTDLCMSKEFWSTVPGSEVNISRAVLVPDMDKCESGIQTGPNFGCIHFKARP